MKLSIEYVDTKATRPEYTKVLCWRILRNKNELVGGVRLYYLCLWMGDFYNKDHS